MTEIPKIGLGTWENANLEQCAESVATALEVGYRHIDTAQAYGNEEGVGDGIRESSVDRDEVFLATKVWITSLEHDDVLSSTERSLERLGTDYVDLLYVHWPAGEYDPEDSFAAFDELHDDGRVRNVGISNFTPELADEALSVIDSPVIANQVEMHPLLPQREMVEYTRENDLALVAYSPLARGEVFDVPEVREVAEKHGVSEARVTLAWLMEIDNVYPIPKATSEEHIRDNYAALELELDDEDVETIDSIGERERIIEPDFAPDW